MTRFKGLAVWTKDRWVVAVEIHGLNFRLAVYSEIKLTIARELVDLHEDPGKVVLEAATVFGGRHCKKPVEVDSPTLSTSMVVSGRGGAGLTTPAAVDRAGVRAVRTIRGHYLYLSQLDLVPQGCGSHYLVEVGHGYMVVLETVSLVHVM